MPTATEYLSTPSLGLAREVRPAQLQMAASIEKVLKDGGIYCGEAGTGVGKSFAYLLPCLLEPKRRIVVATAKKTLQDQILNKDVPAITAIVGANILRGLGKDPDSTGPIAVALKGKSNYVCQELAQEIFRERGQRPGADWTRFIKNSDYGDWVDYPGKKPKWWFRATPDDCSKSCGALANDCGYRRLRRDVMDARIVVVNHHLLGFDVCYGGGAGLILGGSYDTLIVDEAHQLTAGLRNALSDRVTANAIERLRNALSHTTIGFHAMQDLAAAWKDMFKQLPKAYYKDAYTRTIPVFPYGAEKSLEGLIELCRVAKTTICALLREDFSDWPELRAKISEVKDRDNRKELMKSGRVWRRTDDLIDALMVLQGIRETEQKNTVIYSIVEKSTTQFKADGVTPKTELCIIRAPVVTGPRVHFYFKNIKTVVLTSATLANFNKFNHIPSIIGHKSTLAEVLPSPFAVTQAFIYVPTDIPYLGSPSPNWIKDPAEYVVAQAAYKRSVSMRVQRAVDLVRLSDGGAFVLTTANAELDLFTAALKREFPGRVFAQSHARTSHDGLPDKVLAKFKAAGPNAILVGSKSFWEGIDVPGGQLRLVIIVKLPFPSHKDPIIEAREKYWQEYELVHGHHDTPVDVERAAWRRVFVADMITDLRQGSGRAIRALTDRAAIAILDDRLHTSRSYGKETRMALYHPVKYTWSTCVNVIPKYVQYFRNRLKRGSHGAHAVRPVPVAAKSNAPSP